MTLRLTIAGLYGLQECLVAGWVARLVYGTLLSVLFSFLLTEPGFHRLTDWSWKTVVAGVVYGLVLAVVGVDIIMPIWLNVVGFSTPPQIPNITTSTLVWHVIYRVVLGGLFPSVDHLY